jgi:hypothetical protein
VTSVEFVRPEGDTCPDSYAIPFTIMLPSRDGAAHPSGVPDAGALPLTDAAATEPTDAAVTARPDGAATD